MIRHRFVFPRLLAAALLLTALAACAPVRTRGTAAQLEAQAAREREIGAQTRWSLDAHFAVSNGHDGGSGSLSWQQDGDNYLFVLRAPVTGKTVRLQGGPGGAVLSGLRELPIRGDDAESLLATEFGWHMPVAQLAYWVRGLHAPGGAARLSFGANNLPSLLSQDGWSIEFRDWYAGRKPPLPRKVYASKPPYSVRVLIESWQVP
ncbi:MAG: lipoprotein insertase outer membrane protein LolB [Pseudomonadota bacterium]|nr:lipoprotein insertase outer membrane protein LolB [Pseudomonadota bacterium]